VFVQDEAGQTLGELSEFIGLKTNNVAEYSGLLAAIKFALDNGYPRLRVVSDSELMVKQIKGQYRVNSPELKPLYEEAKRRIAQLETFRIEHVLRDKNRQADLLANRAMDRGSGRPTPAEKPARSAEPPKKAAAPIPIVRAGSERSAEPPVKPLRGFVKSGVIHLLDGERLPDGCFVKVIREG
jgi:ribonuclease HI